MRKLIVKVLLLAMTSIMTQNVGAYDFNKGDLYYSKINETEVEVVKNPYGNYTGVIYIPSSIDTQSGTFEVVKIAELAFSSSTVTSITLPNSIKEIDRCAFVNSSSLSSVFWGNNIQKVEEDAFLNCKNLSSVHINDLAVWCNIVFEGTYSNPLMYAHHLFYDNNLITDLIIPEGVTEIKLNAFAGLNEIESVTLPKSLKKINTSAFYWCISLTQVNVESLTDWCSITFMDNPLKYAGNLCVNGEIITDLVIPEGVKKIGDNTFNGCSAVSCIIPAGVDSVGNSAFYNCSFLQEVTIPSDLSYIGNYAFSHCKSLQSINLPNSIKVLGNGVFSGCI